MQNDSPQDERKQRAEKLRDNWQKERTGTIFDLKPFSLGERINFFIEIVFWWSLAFFSLLGALLSFVLFQLQNFEGLSNGRWVLLAPSFCCLLFAIWAARSPWRRAKARQNIVRRKEESPN